jgi:heme exporter protein CcmD
VHDLGTFFAMGGYGDYVWPAYGLTAAAFAGIVAWTLRTLRVRRRLERELAALGQARRPRREARS